MIIRRDYKDCRGKKRRISTTLNHKNLSKKLFRRKSKSNSHLKSTKGRFKGGEGHHKRGNTNKLIIPTKEVAGINR